MEDILHKVTDGLKHYEYGIEFNKMDNYDMSPQLEKEMFSLLTRLNKPQKNLPALTAEIKKYTIRYPQILPFQNYLYSAYMQAGERDKAYELNEKILAEHPDYLFAIINKAAIYYMEEKYDKIPEVLGPMLEIGELQPQRKKFHIIEYLGFSKVVVLYACATDNIELAKNRLEVMEKIAPNMPDTEFAREKVEEKEFELKMRRSWQGLVGDSDYNEIEEDYLSLPQITDEPSFYNPEIAQLYRFSLRIDAGVLHQILLLPRETLIQDLQEVIYDSIRRYEYYVGEDLNEEQNCFPLHAMILLAELKAVESRPVLLEILKQGDGYLDYWYGDMLIEDLWEIYYQVFDLAAYMEYLREPRHLYFAKNMIADVIFRKIENSQLNEQGAIGTYQSLLEYFIDNRENTDVLDPAFMGGLITDICRLNLTALLPAVKTCFDHKIPGEWICGNYQSIERDIRKPNARKKRESILATAGLEKFYLNLTRGLSYYKNEVDEEETEAEDDGIESFRFVENEKANAPALFPAQKRIVGRNDACPCGSGKKYKKCCMN